MTTLTLSTGRVIPLSDRQVARFLSLIGPPTENGCRRWAGRVDRDGYAIFRWKGGGSETLLSAHRLAYRLINGRSPRRDMDVDHRCYDRLCMAHLRQMSIPKNRGGQRKRADLDLICINGHARVGNTRIDPRTGRRCCVLCTKASNQRYLARLQQERRTADKVA